MTDKPDPRHDSPVADGGTGPTDMSENNTDDAEQTDSGLTDEEAATALPDEKQDFLLEAVRRIPLLSSLQSGPTTPDELVDSVDASRSTVHRAISSLEEYSLVERTDSGYQLTGLGRIVAAETCTFGNRAYTAVSLSQFLNSINGHGTKIPIQHFIDAEVTRREPRQPHATIHRIIELIEESASLRMLSTVISPVYVDVGYQEMMNGMEIDAIFDREVVEIMLSNYPEKARETIQTGNFNVYAHDGLPFELFIFDEKIGMAAHNESGTAEVLVESDDPAAMDWAEELYSKHQSEADPLQLSE